MNIFAMCDVTKHFRVTMGSAVDNAIYVHMNDRSALRFQEVELGLYVLCQKYGDNISKSKVSDY